MSLQLEKDAKVSIQTHIDEFSSRFSILIVLWLMVSLIWMLRVDLVLEYVVDVLDPCNSNNCSNLYNPAKWSEIRWLGAALLGFITIIPIIALQFYTFSKPGLMKSEAKGLMFWLVFSSLGFIANIIITILLIMPSLFGIGHEIQVDLGFTPKYDIVTMLSLSIGIIWVEILIAMGILTLLVANSTGNLSGKNLTWWKLRIHGIISMLIMLSFYGQISFIIFLLLTSYVCIEIVTSPWIKKSTRLSLDSPIVFDQYGVDRKMLFANCECEREENIDTDLFTNAYYSFKKLCEKSDEQETLYQLINTNEFTDMIVFGCNNVEKMSHIEPNVYISKCKFRNDFITHNLENYCNLQQYNMNTKVRIASLVDPWNDNQAYQKILQVLQENVEWMPVFVSNDDFQYFPDTINANDLVIYASEITKNKLVNKLNDMGRKFIVG